MEAWTRHTPRRGRLGVALVVAAAIVASLGFTRDRPPPPAPDATALGVALGLFASDPGYDYGAMLTEIRDRGATDVLLVINWTQRDVTSHVIAATPGHTPTTATVEATIVQARQLGLRVGLMPVVLPQERAAGQWRGRLAPAAGADAWFDSYRGHLLPLAELAERHTVERLIVGSELCSLERHEAQWRSLIAAVRGRFRGRVSYSANWDHFADVPFWDAVDEIGVTGYFALDPEDPRGSWEAPLRALRALKARVGRPLLLTEVGYAPHRDAARRPWDEGLDEDGPPALEVQAELYSAFCDAFAAEGLLDGFYFWNWFGYGGPRDRTYTPRGKPAAARMERCLGRPEWRRHPVEDER